MIKPLRKLDFLKALSDCGIKVGEIKKGDKPGIEIAPINICPVAERSHEDGGSYVMLFNDRTSLRFGCQHNTCKEKLRVQDSLSLLKELGFNQDADDNFQQLGDGAGRSEQKFDFQRVWTGDELDQADIKLEYLVNSVMVRGQCMVVGGATKVCKTNVMMDLCLSVATGTPFLGEYETSQGPTLFCTGETGDARSQMVYRAVKEARGIKSPVNHFFYTSEVPKITDEAWLKSLRLWITNKELQILAIDPYYLAIGQQMNDVTSGVVGFGDLLQPLTELGHETNCTIVLAHHSTKQASRTSNKGGQPMEPMDLSGAGISEFMRQWILLSRRERFNQGSGEHKLYMNVGGSAGHSLLAAVDINEGTSVEQALNESIRWDVRVSDANETQRVERRKKREVEITEKSEALLRHMLRNKCQLVPVTINQLFRGIGQVKFGSSQPIIAKCLEQLIDTGRVVEVAPPPGARKGQYFKAIWNAGERQEPEGGG